MRQRLSFDPLRLSLLAALGLGACGGNVIIDPEGSGGAGAGGGGPTTTATTGPGGGSFPGECEGATPVPAANGSDSGFARCPDGTIHRNAPVTCDPTINGPGCFGNEAAFACVVDSDCTDGPHGRCLHFEGGFENPEPWCGCAYSCAEDSDCQGNGVCVCAGVVENGKGWSACAGAANCKSGAGCASGECGITSFNDGCFWNVELACRTPGDVCRVNTDCGDDGTECVTVYGSGTYSCEFQNCAIGRPLRVAGATRSAPDARRDDWLDRSARPDVGPLDAEARAAIAARYRAIAALEHASIASFARFSLELLALGAPPDLVLAAQQAGADEIEHARIAYAIAAAFDGQEIGPGALDVSGLRVASDRREILRGLIEDACVGETLGAAEALAVAGEVDDPALAAAHRRVAADEARHAELAWRALRFLLRGACEDDARFARAAFERAMEAASRDPEPDSATGGFASPRHGVLSAQAIGAIRRQALREVVRPCVEAALGAASLGDSPSARAGDSPSARAGDSPSARAGAA